MTHPPELPELQEASIRLLNAIHLQVLAGHPISIIVRSAAANLTRVLGEAVATGGAK